MIREAELRKSPDQGEGNEKIEAAEAAEPGVQAQVYPGPTGRIENASPHGTRKEVTPDSPHLWGGLMPLVSASGLHF